MAATNHSRPKPSPPGRTAPDGPRVFISHSSKNQPLAAAVLAEFEGNGIRCWMAPRDIRPGEPNYGKAIIEGLTACEAMVLLLTEPSNRSQHVMKEAERAVNKNIPILVVKFQPIEVSKELEYYVSSAQFLDATAPPPQQHLRTIRHRVRAILALANAGAASAGIAVPVNDGSGKAYDVFVSHSSRDRAVADAACACLESTGLRCWIAHRDIVAGADWGAAIIAAIKRAKVMVLILSSHANVSPQVQREVERAVNRGIPVLPFRIEDVDLSDSLEYFLSSAHWLNAYRGELRLHLEKLAISVAVVIEKQDALRPLMGSTSPAAAGVGGNVLREGRCAACGTVTSDLTRKFCRNPECGASLRVPCIKCDFRIPVWDGVCGECGWNRLASASGGNNIDTANEVAKNASAKLQEVTKRFDEHCQRRGLFVLLLDQSLSMQGPIAHASTSKGHALASAINTWLANACVSCATDSGFEDLYDVAVIRYFTDEEANPIIESALAGPLAGKELVAIGEIASNPVHIETAMSVLKDERAGLPVEVPLQVPIWMYPLSRGATPICSAICKACEIIDEWIACNPQGSPPVVINITDGESSEGDPVPYADALKQRVTDVGNAVFFNCCLGASWAYPLMTDAVMLKSNELLLPDSFARTLFRMSSPLPEAIVEKAQRAGHACESNARGFAYNADSNTLIQFLDLLTPPLRAD